MRYYYISPLVDNEIMFSFLQLKLPIAIQLLTVLIKERGGLVVNSSNSGSRGWGSSPTRVKPCCVL